MGGYIIFALFIFLCLYILYLFSKGGLHIFFRMFGGKEWGIFGTRYELHIPEKNKPKFTYIFMAAILGFIVINWNDIENSISYNFQARWHGKGSIDSSINVAVERALLLDVITKHTSRGDTWGVRQGYCTEDEVLREGSEFYGKCRILKSNAYDTRCGYFYYNAHCRSFKVSNELWQNKVIRKKIIHVALNPCKFLYYSNQWGSGCSGGAQVNVVYFEVYEDEYFSDTDNHPYLEVYKAKK